MHLKSKRSRIAAASTSIIKYFDNKKIAGNAIAAIRLLNFEDADGIVSLNVQELPEGRTYTLSELLLFN